MIKSLFFPNFLIFLPFSPFLFRQNLV